jgi:6-pyruvoyltetrahydropterin/6-carboxytetrahydropterin synthase
MAYDIRIESYFSAAHRLRGYRGKCEGLHGHNWKVGVTISSEMLDKTGMVFDFKKAKSILDEILNTFDHKDLNAIQYFKKNNPTSECIAEFIYNEFAKRLKPALRLKSVCVWETPTSSATFSKES